MTDLHWALIAVAVALLLALWIYGKWQERRTRARIDAAMRQGVGDPLAQMPRSAPAPAGGVSRRIEPRLESQPQEAHEETVAGEVAAAADPAPQAEAENDAAAERADASAYALPDGWVEDPLLDFVIELRCTHAIDGVAALEAKGQLERLHLPLPTHLAVWDAKSQQWTAPDRFGFYSELLLAVQMAHRNGVLGEIDATRFVATAQQIAVGVDADFDAPDVPRLVAQAAELDQLCARFDVQITLTVEATQGPWTADTVQAAASEAEFVALGQGRWESRDERGEPVLALTAASFPTERLAVSIDVPVVRPEGQPLVKQFAAADTLAVRLNGRIVDDNGRPVQREAHFSIAAQLAGMYEQMHVAGVEAGSVRAKRLYAG
jgi:hypothetical protein